MPSFTEYMDLTGWKKWVESRSERQWSRFGTVLTAAALGALVLVLFRGRLELQTLDWGAFGAALVQAVGLYLVSVVAHLLMWARLVSLYRPVCWQDVEIFGRTILMRSLPGGPWHWVGRTAMYAGTSEIPSTAVMKGNWMEWTVQLLIGAALFCAVAEPVPFAARALAAVFLWVIAVRTAAHAQTAMGGSAVRWLEASFWVFLQAVSWLAALLIFRVLVWAVAGPVLSWMQVSQVWAVVGCISLLTVVLPSSFGLREVSLVLFLSPYLSAAQGAVIALLMRVVYNGSDLLWGCLAWWGGRLAASLSASSAPQR